jgi:hypothetical protein
MGCFSYKCDKHGGFQVLLPKRLPTYYCPMCDQQCPSVIKLGTITVKERLDNGAMSRAVEQLANIDEIAEERSRKHSVKQEEEE